MDTMTKEKQKSKAKPKASAGDEPEASWAVFARLDPAIRKPVESYIASREYPPPLARVIERALRLLLEKEGYWPQSD